MSRRLFLALILPLLSIVAARGQSVEDLQSIEKLLRSYAAQ